MKLVIFFALLLLVKFENKNKIKTNFFDLNTGTSSRESDEAKSNIVGFLYVFVIFVFNFKFFLFSLIIFSKNSFQN